MTDRWQKEAERLLTSAVNMDMAQCAEALAAALSDAYEAGRRAEREACAKVVEDHPRSIPINDDDAAAIGMLAREAGPRDYAAAIRSREAVE